ncbi:uncharacterized protein LOC118458432 [Anopheles albimanus]|uniref:uncharacterized protein LOC118458432 n=1 Tax=Anopheles albimanus TaxID=7167 RepID=UPI00163EC057|nr:uncharacterized protein LOC118458432 [Anopheles albimanus]
MAVNICIILDRNLCKQHSTAADGMSHRGMNRSADPLSALYLGLIHRNDEIDSFFEDYQARAAPTLRSADEYVQTDPCVKCKTADENVWYTHYHHRRRWYSVAYVM